MSKKVIAWRQAGLVRRAKTSRRNPADLARSLPPVANSLSPEQEKRTMRKPEVQIGNSGLEGGRGGGPSSCVPKKIHRTDREAQTRHAGNGLPAEVTGSTVG